MNRNIIKTVLLFFLFVSVISCSDDSKESFVEGNTTELKQKIVEADSIIAEATTIDYEQRSIDEFQEKVSTINTVVTIEKVSEQEVVNLTVNLQKAQIKFLNSKLSQIPSENLLAAWDFDLEGTSLKAAGTRGLIATLKPGPSEIFTTPTIPQFRTDGKNSSLYFSNGGHLEIDQYNPSDFLGKQLSICVWLKPEVTKAGNYVASLNYWENWKLQVQENGKLSFTVKTGAGVTDADNEADQSVKVGEWTLVIISLDLDANKLTLYTSESKEPKVWDNIGKPALAGSQVAAYQSPQGMLPLMIGACTNYEQALFAKFNWAGWNTPTGWWAFQGSMDEFKIYNIALTSGQMRWLYNSEKEYFEK